MREYWVVLILFFISACTANSEEELGAFDADRPLVDFQLEIRPIIDLKCALPACHAQGVTGRPDLSDDGVVAMQAENIRVEIASGRMPVGRTLTSEERDLIFIWIAQGGQVE